jgi:hypothetical protein
MPPAAWQRALFPLIGLLLIVTLANRIRAALKESH